MLRIMRKNAQSWIVKFVFGVIIVVFSFWGVGSMKAKQMTVAATVNGKTIERKTLDNSFRDLWRRYQEQAKGKFDPDAARIRQIKQEALNSLVDRQLLLDQAARLGLTVSDAELRQRIASLGAFQRDGHFDQETYRRALSYNRLTPNQFEAGFEEDILLEKVRSVVGDGVKLVPDEVDILLRQQQEEIAAELLSLAPADYQAAVVVKEAELEKFFADKKEDFRVPVQRKIAALVLNRNKLLESIPVTDAQVAEYYQENLEKYNVSEQVKARHILIKVAQDASPEEVEKAEQEINDILAKVKAGGDFAELAKKYSQGPSNSMGGDLGWFGRGSMVKPFEEAAFALTPGTVSEPVRTQFGLHLIKNEEYKPAHTKSLDEVKAGIVKSLRAEALPELLQERLKEVAGVLSASDRETFAAQARKLEYPVVETAFFKEKDVVVPDIGKDPALIAESFKTAVGQISEVVNPARNSYYFMVTEEKESYLPDLAEVKEAVEKAYRYELAKAEVKGLSKKVAAALTGGQSLKDAAAAIGAQLIDTGFFVRGRGAVPKIGNDPQLSQQLFALNLGQTSAALAHNDGFIFALLRERRLEPGADGAKLKADIEQQLLQYKRYRIMDEFVQGLRQDADIKVMAGVLD
ncbi:MAG: SurA N-terminal domain-containing protein [Deltaproteobacteria bacterium]|nr:SurA N-terminal domain-containing protein [Deltaproteobacteria bacterium]